MNIIFESPMEMEDIVPLVEATNKEEGLLDIWFSSDGGNVNAMMVLHRVLNAYPGGFNIHITGAVQSCGFWFCLLNKEHVKSVEYTAWGMVHIPTREVTTSILGDILEKEYTYYKSGDYDLSKMLLESLEEYPSVQSRVRNNEDVYINYVNLKKMMNPKD